MHPAIPAARAAVRLELTSKRRGWSAVIYIAAAAMFLRMYDLPLKPMHHDEAVNTLFVTNLVRPPHQYQYDPANYHGPTLYYFAWLSTAVFGLTTFAVRFVTALSGLATVLLLLCLGREIGWVGAGAAAALLAVSPGAVYFSRYFIHESLLVCFTVGVVVAGARWLRERRPADLLLASASAGLMFATKETAIISMMVLIGAAVGAAWLFELRRWPRDGLPRRSPRLLSVLGRWRQAGVTVPRPARGLFLGLAAIVLFLGVNVLFYTSLLSHWPGAIDAFSAFAIWTKTGTIAHTREWHAYLSWLAQEELPLLLLGTAGAALALWRADNRFATFAGLWAIGMLAAYSVIPYKTPWLTLNIIAPLAISAGYASELISRYRLTALRGMAVVVAAAVLGTASYQAVILSFARYDDDRYPYVYAHTHREVLTLVHQIQRIAQRNPRLTIAVTSKDHFPLSWYLRDYPVGYYGRVVVTNDALVIGSAEQRRTLDVALGDRYEQIGSYRLRPGVRLVLYVRRDVGHSA